MYLASIQRKAILINFAFKVKHELEGRDSLKIFKITSKLVDTRSFSAFLSINDIIPGKINRFDKGRFARCIGTKKATTPQHLPFTGFCCDCFQKALIGAFFRWEHAKLYRMPNGFKIAYNVP